jgi:metal-sulfur cluster biosynthetic enzyme
VVVEEALNPMPAEPTAGQAAAATSAARQISEDLVREELKKVIDPELFVNIVDLGLIYNVDLVPADGEKTNCKIDMTMTSPMCPAGPQMIANSKQVLGQLPGMGDVEVKIVLDPPWTPDKMTDEARDQLGIF